MMQGLTTDYVTLIRRDLRERLGDGFTILKELLQNADDAKARTLIFGRHDGFSRARHPLLKGPGLWFFNDGEFKRSDANALRSFGINSKAGDASTIGKFGLGMKSVFHLCEALFYMACDGTDFHHEGLTPWKQDGPWPHPEWDETDDADWNLLTDLGKALAKETRTWFLLWLPLRMRMHMYTLSGQESAPIIPDFPGDDTSSDALRFLRQPTLARDVAEILPCYSTWNALSTGERAIALSSGSTARVASWAIHSSRVRSCSMTDGYRSTSPGGGSKARMRTAGSRT